jgi:hypothetical protein
VIRHGGITQEVIASTGWIQADFHQFSRHRPSFQLIQEMALFESLQAKLFPDSRGQIRDEGTLKNPTTTPGTVRPAGFGSLIRHDS